MHFLPPEFDLFTAPDCDRYEFLCSLFKKDGIDFSSIVLEEKKHIYINFPKGAYNPLFRIKTVIVHYDRVEGTPGANDNSAAVFQVLDFVRRLWQFSGIHNMRIIFTDGEELGDEQGVSAQGSFAIGSKFRNLGIVNDDVFVFDGCGRGNVLVISTAGKNSAGSARFRKRFDQLYQTALRLAASVSPESWITLPVPYSDNAGFIASGIPAIAVTLLPAQEASALALRLKRDRALEQGILTNTVRNTSKGSQELLPLTWTLMHTPEDRADTLTSEAFDLMKRFLDALASAKTLQD